ncbi:hypothetical protein BK816_08310 [Boudabousia tangfeifanii]|uniref:Uncharacterized protein n=1 Tax=Boudabousia tangfeifanii TaxID=1912795 RepID=A0A1D9MLW2_9ACTO|nr:hypothetical protein [Boudabousia tangfeifanii]AOZ73282.1 hypothetical protein BK816_08310 [Boudabousia tangfeifanii]
MTTNQNQDPEPIRIDFGAQMKLALVFWVIMALISLAVAFRNPFMGVWVITGLMVLVSVYAIIIAPQDFGEQAPKRLLLSDALFSTIVPMLFTPLLINAFLDNDLSFSQLIGGPTVVGFLCVGLHFWQRSRTKHLRPRHFYAD